MVLRSRPLQVGLIAVLIVLLFAAPYLVAPYYVALLCQVLFYALLAMSVDLLGGYTGLMPVGHAGIMGISAYVLGYLISTMKAPVGVAVVAAIVGTLLVSFVFGWMAVRTKEHFFVAVTLAQGMIVWGLATKWTEVTNAENGLRGISRPFFATLQWQYYYLVLIVCLICFALLILIVRSPFGLTLKGIRESESRMRTLGYDTTLHKLIAFMISGFFAGIAGILLAWYNMFISPASAGLTRSAMAVLATLVGGAGTLVGSILGAAIIVVLENIVSTATQRWTTIMGIVFVVAVLFAREGIIGLGVKLAQRRSGPAGLTPAVATGAPNTVVAPVDSVPKGPAVGSK